MKKHLKCWLWKLLWLGGAFSLLCAWAIGLRGGGEVFGLHLMTWVWNALVLGILAVPIKMDCSDCGVCGVE